MAQGSTTFASINGISNAVGGGGNDAIIGDGNVNVIDGGAGEDWLASGGANDTFVFHAGQADGDTIEDFVGNGSSAGDAIRFVGFGTAAQGATFTRVGSSNEWKIHSGLDGHEEFIVFDNSASVHASDYLFM